jgi:hypothetical protein
MAAMTCSDRKRTASSNLPCSSKAMGQEVLPEDWKLGSNVLHPRPGWRNSLTAAGS